MDFLWLPSAANRYRFDGTGALDAVLRRAGYATLVHAAAAFSAFHHPDTVKQTQGRALFRVVRCRDMTQRGKCLEQNGCQLMQDDNYSPTYAFMVPVGAKACKDTQFNHLWRLKDWQYYTALWNICPTPAFISKPTDTSEDVRAALQYRSFDLYGYLPKGSQEPIKPKSYEKLPWSDPLPAVKNLEERYRERLKHENNRVSRFARKYGWLYSDYKPDKGL